jgi:hypothetical protein
MLQSISSNRHSPKNKKDQFSPTASSSEERLSPTAVLSSYIYKNNIPKPVQHYCIVVVSSQVQINLKQLTTRGNLYD